MNAWLGRAGVLTLVALAGTSGAARAAASDSLPSRHGNRLLAVTTLSGGGGASGSCITPIVQSVRSDPQRATLAARRSLGWLASDAPLIGERRVVDGDGNVIRFTTDRASVDRVDVIDENGNGRPDPVDGAIQGLARARRLLVGQLELPAPGALEIVIARLGSNVDGLAVASPRNGRFQIWLDPTARPGAAGLRRTAEHQYAHAVAAASGLGPAWGESLASWTGVSLEGGLDERMVAAIDRRLGASGAGLIVDDLDLATGNAVWLSFLAESEGPAAVKVAIDELGRGGPERAALDRAVRRVTGRTLDQALRDFQVWSLLTGPRDDHRHFSFASRLGGPSFTSTVEALPALSVQADPELAPMGFAAVLLKPGERSGGMNVRFEGDLTTRWAADLLLIRDNGTMHLAPLSLDADQAAELTVPLQGVAEAVLLVRNHDADAKAWGRYTWGARLVPGYPVEFGELKAEPAGDAGMRVSWQTEGEREVLGFNVLRFRGEAGPAIRINPVWIPPIGGGEAQAAYSFLDTTAEPGITYRYRVEAVTPEGLTSRSELVPPSSAH